jgi:predicted DNA-binding helix-hairpin-helix protein
MGHIPFRRLDSLAALGVVVKRARNYLTVAGRLSPMSGHARHPSERQMALF